MHGFNRFQGPPGALNFPPGFLHRGPPPNQHNFYMPPHQQSPRQQVSYSDITVFHNGAKRQQVNHGKNFGHLPPPNFNTPPPRHHINYGDADMFASNPGQQFNFNPQQNAPSRANFPQNQQMGNLWQNNGNQNGHWDKQFQNVNGNFADNGYNDMKGGHKNRKPWNNNIWNNLPKDSNRKQEQFQKKKKKPKVDKRDLAENNLYFCDTCDRGFKVMEKYEEHVNSHVKCRHEGCSYTAHPKLVQLHDRTQHSSGLASKIWKLESPEDIAKWREERKRNFPTAATVLRKKEILQEKIARGEIIETKTFGKMKNKGGKRDKFGKWNNKRQDKRNNHGKQEGRSPSKIGMAQTKVPVENVEKERSFDGDPLSMLEGFEETIPNPKQAECAIGALASLMANYSDSEEDKPSQTDKHTDNMIPNVENEDQDQSDQRNKRGRKRKRQRKNGSDPNTQPKVRKSTLLEKLLAPDIRRERNLVLQCVYHIVKENFYGIGSSKERNEPKLMTNITQDNTEGQVIKPVEIKTESDNCVSQGCSQTETLKQEIKQETDEETKHLKAQESDAEQIKLDEIERVSEGLIDDHAWE